MRKKDEKEEPKPIHFTQFMMEVISDLEREERFSTAHVYMYALHAFTDYVGGGTIFFGGISRNSLKRFEKFLTNRQNKWNTISTYTRALRSVYHRAVDAEIIEGEYRLFSGVYTGTKAEKKRALNDEEMRCLLQDPELCPPLPNETQAEAQARLSQLTAPLCEARDLLSLMFRLQGMPLVDLTHLRRNALHTDATGRTMLTCLRQKTGTELNICVTPEVLTLIDRYRSTDPESPYLLRFLNAEDKGIDAYYAYGRLLRRLNLYLGRLAAHYGMQAIRVSSYTARHTWATIAKFCHIPEEVISEGLGHSSLEVTRTYLKSFEYKELDNANRTVMKRVFKN